MRTSSLLQLSEQLSLGSDEVIQAVKLAINNPNKCFEERSEQLEERDIDELPEDLPWIVLVDELIERELAIEVDWKESSHYIYEMINVLLSTKELPELDYNLVENSEDQALKTEQFLSVVSKKLKEQFTALAYLDIDSDSYVLITVPLNEIVRLKELTREAGYTISDTFV